MEDTKDKGFAVWFHDSAGNLQARDALRKAAKSCEGRDAVLNVALHQTVKNGDVELAKVLIEDTADVNSKDQEGRTPLHHAAVLENPEPMIRLLLDKGGDIQAKDQYGITAWQYAKENEAFTLMDNINPEKDSESEPITDTALQMT